MQDMFTSATVQGLRELAGIAEHCAEEVLLQRSNQSWLFDMTAMQGHKRLVS